MGYGEYRALVIYGWCEDQDNKTIDYEWLEEADLEHYGIGTSKGYTYRFAYGIECDLDEETGTPELSKEEKSKVRKAHKKSGTESTLGFFSVLSGDIHEVYTPGKAKKAKK